VSAPSAWRIFRVGVNPSTKGPVLFDAKAANDVMADYRQHGADQMLDLEHLSLDRSSPSYDPNARAWYQLQIRNGELWAVNARWTPDGQARLAAKSQRYISPFFAVDPGTRRVKRVINSALTALPASDKPMALIAASDRPLTGLLALSTLESDQMDLSLFAAALGLPPDATADDIVAAIKALQGEKEAAPAAPVASSEAGDGGATATPPSGPGAPAGLAPARKTTVSIQHTQDASAAAVIELSQKVARLEAASLADKRTALIKVNASKLTPVLEAWANTQSIETLTTFFAAKGPEETVDQEAERESVTGASETIALSQAELQVCKDNNLDPKAVLAYKQKEAANRGSK
jgi:phage I-like protein